MAYTKEQFRAWKEKNREKCREHNRRYKNSPKGKEKARLNNKKRWWQIRLKVLSSYSQGKPICASCGFSDIKALSIDHIGGGGNQHRREIHKHLYDWLIQENYPGGFQVLCMNCQLIKRNKRGEGVGVKHPKSKRYNE